MHVRVLGSAVVSGSDRKPDDFDHHIGRVAAERAYEQAQSAPIGQPITWNNPDNGHAGAVTPVREGTNDQTGEYCREFQQTVTIGGRPENAYGVACQQPDGAWRIVQ